MNGLVVLAGQGRRRSGGVIHPMTLSKWLRVADTRDGTKPDPAADGSAELWEAKRRIRLLEQENEVLRRAAASLSQAHLPGQ